MQGRYKNIDQNQPEIVELLRFCGYEVTLLSANGGGVPDLLVAIGFLNVLFEVKMPGKKLNEEQVKWWAKWSGEKYIVFSRSDALHLAAAIEARDARRRGLLVLRGELRG